MIKILKSNKFISILLFIMCILIIIKPLTYSKACLNGISVWTFKVMPLMFPFFILTKLISSLNSPKTNFMDKFFNKVYNSPTFSFSTFILSVLAGYPMGAKLISNLYNNKFITNEDAKKMLSFCSVSGPMFMIGTVGVSMLYSYKAGLIILISNIIASLLNGLFYRGKRNTLNQNLYNLKANKTSLSDCVYDSLISVLMIGCYITISFILIEILNQIGIVNLLANTFSFILNGKVNSDVTNSIFYGLIEITCGINSLSSTHISLQLKTILSSSLIAFGGFSILLQSLNFLKEIKISTSTIIKQKLTQTILCLIITTCFCLIFV